jgi:hypothetical protein
MPRGDLFQNETGCSECDLQCMLDTRVLFRVDLTFNPVKNTIFYLHWGQHRHVLAPWHLTCVARQMKFYVLCTLFCFSV